MFASPHVSRTQIDKIRTESRDAMLTATWQLMGKTPDRVYDTATGEFRQWKDSPNRAFQKPLRTVAALLEAHGVSRNEVDCLGNAQLAAIALGSNPGNFRLSMSAGDAHYNVTGMFQSIMLDAQNVVLRQGYTEAPSTYERWAKKAENAPDFRDVNSIIGGEVGDPKAIGEDGEFEETTLIDGKEKYALTVYGHTLSVTWQLMQNDSVGVFMKAPIKMVRSMKRKQNRLVYQELKANRALSDNVALFHNTHGNLSTGAVTDYAVAVGSMVAKLAVQKALGDDAGALNLVGRHLIFPPALQNKLATLIASLAIPGGTNDTANIYQGAFEPVMDAELAAAFGGSDTAFYLVCDHLDCDTVTYAFLEGFEEPKIETQTSFERLGIRQRIYQPFAVKAMDYRGMQKHDGA